MAINLVHSLWKTAFTPIMIDNKDKKYKTILTVTPSLHCMAHNVYTVCLQYRTTDT